MAKHPKGLYLLFFTEMWERFSFYGMRAILVLYMVQALRFNRSDASTVFGSYLGLVYLTPLLGGYMADRYWGNRRSIVVGGILMALAQLILFLSGSVYQNRELANLLMFTGLGFLIFGNGFFKPNISTMVGQLYPAGDRRVDAAFTIFYMGINLGAALGPVVCGGLGERRSGAEVLPEYFRWGFLAAGVGMLVSVVSFQLYKNRYLLTPDGIPIGVLPNKARDVQTSESPQGGFTREQLLIWGSVFVVTGLLFYHLMSDGLLQAFKGDVDFNALISAVIFASAIAAVGLIISDKSLQHQEKDRIWVIFVSCFFVIFFWSAFEQAGASLTYFAAEQTQRQIDLHVPMYLVQGASLGLALLLVFLAVRGRRALRDEPVSISVFLLGTVVAALGYLVYQNIAFIRDGQNDLYFEQIPASFFQSVNAIAIVIFAPFFAMMWTALGNRGREPASLVKQALGLLLLALGYALISWRVRDLDPAVKVSMFWLVALYVTHTWGELCLSPIGLSLVARLAPARFASLLMAVWFMANAVAGNVAGKLSALYPPSPQEFAKAAAAGIDLHAVLDQTVVPSAEQLARLKEMGVRAAYPMLLGVIEIRELDQFFMIFVVSAGLASVILMLLCPKLLRMMHGIR